MNKIFFYQLLLSTIIITNSTFPQLVQNMDEKNKYFVFDINNIYFPINNKGVIGDIDETNVPSYAKFDSVSFLYSGGFFVSGFANGELFGNGEMTSSRIEDYQPGKIGSDADDSLNQVYIVSNDDIPFSSNWQKWKDAVSLGADFYDGDHNGTYDPIDINNNGYWDENEDKPEILGDVTAWTIYNDGIADSLRRFTDEQPMGIEIHQTVFAYKEKTTPLGNVIFLRYRIKNTGLVSPKLEDIYFSVATDPDLGDYTDDYVGSDINLSAGYAYNKEEDSEYGADCPSFVINFLHGPVIYKPGESFIDNDDDGEFNPAVDTVIDSAFILNARLNDIITIPGAKNIDATSIMQYLKSLPSHGDPDNAIELRNLLIGGHETKGDSIYISNWQYGNGSGLGEDTLNIPSHFMYSGDPEENSGWLCTIDFDQRLIVNTGPFDLNEGESQDIYALYAVGRGTTTLNSISVAKEIAKKAEDHFYSSIIEIPVGVEESDESNIIKGFSLSQNYPNPFNPTTKISYQIPKDSFVNLIVYNSLGQEITKLVNKNQSRGKYSVKFNAKNLSSGVYFYKIESGTFAKVNKMLLLR